MLKRRQFLCSLGALGARGVGLRARTVPAWGGAALAVGATGCSHAPSRPALPSTGPKLERIDIGSGPDVVVFVPGLGADVRQFAADAEALAADVRCVVLSMRGHGASFRPQEENAYSLQLLAADVLDELEGLGIERAHLVGNSMGGLVCFELLAQRPDLVRTLTTFGTTAELHRGGATAWTVVSLTNLLGAGGMGWLASQTASEDEQVGALVGDMMASAETRALAELAASIADYSYLDTLRSTTNPYLLLKGEADVDINSELESTIEALQSRPASSVLEVPGAGHFLNLERPACFRAVLKAFWSGGIDTVHPSVCGPA